jgi:hypothetical protein
MPMQGPLDEYRNGDNTVDWNKIFSAYRNVSFAGPQLTDLQKQDAELKQNQQGASLVGAAKKTGMSALRVFGGIADMPRQAVVATGTGLWNSAIAPVLNAVTDGPDWQTDVNDDGQVTSDDNIVGQWSRVLKPFDDRNVIGMGRLAPFLQTEKDDSVLERGLKMTGAFAGDLLTDPTFIAGSSKRALTTAQQVLFAGESAMELAPKLIGKEVSEEAAKDFVVGRLARKNPDELARLANEYGVEATEEGFSIIGKSTDEMAKSLTDSLDSGSVSRLFAEEFSKETQAAMRRNNFSGPRRFMEAEFGDETGRAIYNQLPAVVRGAPEVGIPGTKLRKVVDGPYGGGQIIEKFGPVGHIIEEALIRKQRGLDRGIAALTFGENRVMNKIARSAAVEAGTAVAMSANQSNIEHRVLAETRAKLAANTAVGELKRMVDDAKVLDTAAGARAKSSNMAQQFIDAKSRFFNENDLNAVDTSKLTEVELDAFRSIQAKRNVEAQYVKYKEKYGDLFSSAGIIEGQRRVLTQQGADHLNEVEARIRAGKTTKFRGREAFQNEDGSWRSVEDINAEVGFKFFEDDPEIAHRLYVQRMQDALNNAAHTKTLMDAGIWWRASKDSGTVFGVAGTAARRLERNATKAETASDAIRTDRIMTPASLVKGEMGDAVDTAAAAVKSEREIYFELLNTANARFLAEKQRLVDQAKKILADESLGIDERLVVEREHVAALKEQRAVLAKDIKAARRDSKKMRAKELATAEAELTRITSVLDEAEGQYKRSVESYETEIGKLTKDRDTLRRKARKSGDVSGKSKKDIKARFDKNSTLKGGSAEEHLSGIRDSLQKAVDSETQVGKEAWGFIGLVSAVADLEDSYTYSRSYWREVSNELEALADGRVSDTSTHIFDPYGDGYVSSLDDTVTKMRSYLEGIADRDYEATDLLDALNDELTNPRTIDWPRMSEAEKVIADTFGYDELRKVNLDDTTGVQLMAAMSDGWEGSFDDLLDATEALGQDVRWNKPVAKSAIAEAADAAQQKVVSMRNAHINQRTIMEGRLSAVRSQHSEAMLRRDMLADLEQPTTFENTINGMDDILASINADLAATGTAAERNAASGRAKGAMRTEVQRLRDEQAAAKQVVREKNAEFRTGETQMESQPALDAATSRLEQLNEIVSTAKEVSTAKKTAIDAALSAQRSKDTRVLKKLMALIDDAPISEDLRSLVKANEENLKDEFDLMRLLGKRSAGNAKDIRTIMAAIGSIKDEASRREAMHALIEKTIKLGAEEVGDSEKLLMEVIDKAFDKRLNLSFKDVGEANRLRAQIEERTNKVGVEAASEDKTVQRLEKKLKEIEDRADTELHERAAEESTRDYAARIEEQIKEEINSPEMKAVARDIKEYVKQFDKAEEGKAAAFGLQTSGEYLDSLVTEGIRRGDYQRIGNVKARGKTIPVPAYLEDMVTHSILAPGFARQYRITTNPVAMYPHAYTALQSLETIWKTSVTVMRGPSFVIRNVLGGMYNALLGGTESRDFALGLKYAKALNTAYKEAELAAFSEEGRNLLRPDNIGSFLEGYIEKNMSFEAMDGVSMYELHKKMTVRNIFGGSVMAEIQGSDPLTVRPGSYRKSYRDLAASINKSDMYAVERGLYPVGNAILNNPYTQMMSGWQENAERYLRSAQYFAGVRRGGGTEASHMYADMLVKATQFDYSDLSNFERKFLRHVAPFYTFTRNNLPLQLRSLVNRPGVPMAVLRMNYYANEYFGADPDSEVGRQVRENLAPWLSEAEAFPSMFGGDSPVIIGIGAPLIDINRFLPDQNDLTTWSGIKALPMNTLGGFTEESTSQLSPFVKLGVESLSGQNTFTGSPYRDRTVSPFMERLLFPFDKGIDKETGERKYSGFAEAQVKNFLPLIGQVSRLAPVGPFEDKNQQARWKTNVLGSGVGLSGLPVAPIATASPEQLSTWMYGNNKDANKEANKEFAEIGLDWSEITRAKNKYSWNQIADMVERGWFAAQYVEEGGGPSPEQIRQALEVAQRMRQLDEDR